MLIHELTPAECRDVLARATYGRLGCARGDQPYVVPFVFQLDKTRDCMYSFSTLGQKIDWMRENPKVCVEVDEVIDQFTWTSVLAFGRFEEIRDTSEDEHLRRKATDLFHRRSDWWLPALGKLASGEEHHSSVVYRILIDKLTGRRAARAG
jgi:nitroimidazol reductase NimA-like FMN-containing flavoprotein (pyridoxamine 5'-phosphate oxidase superfamily)